MRSCSQNISARNVEAAWQWSVKAAVNADPVVTTSIPLSLSSDVLIVEEFLSSGCEGINVEGVALTFHPGLSLRDWYLILHTSGKRWRNPASENRNEVKSSSRR